MVDVVLTSRWRIPSSVFFFVGGMYRCVFGLFGVRVVLSTVCIVSGYVCCGGGCVLGADRRSVVV